MATSRINIGNKFKNADIPSENDFEEIFDSFVHKDEDKANFQMVETGTDDQHYVTPALLRTGLQNIGIITGNSYMPIKEHFDNFTGSTLPLQKLPVNFSVKAFKNGQLLLEKENETDEGDYIINYDTAVITFSYNIDNRNIEVDYWYKNLTPNPGGGSGQQIDFGSFLHTSGNETKNGILTFNNITPTSTSGIVLTNSGADAGAKVLDVTVSGAGSGISVQNTATGTGVKLSNSGAGVGVSVNATATSTGDALQVTKDNVVKAKIDKEGNVTASKFVTSGGTEDKFVKGDGSLDPKTYAEDTKVIHSTGNESKDGALNLTHNDAVQDVLTITKNNSANCLKLVQNSSSNATTSTFDTGSDDFNRKAISVQKKTVEKAFITHDGNVSGTSFTTLNEKADITDGFLTLAGSTTPTVMADHAKLYAKKDGANTDMYVMGSDGVEKKIGGAVDLSGKENTIASGTTAQYFRGDKTWQTLDKASVGLTNVDNTSDLNKPVSMAIQTELNKKLNKTGPDTFSGTLTVDSGSIDNSGLILNKIPSNQPTGKIIVNTTNLTNQLVGGTRMPDGSIYFTLNTQGKISKIALDGTVTSFVTTDLGTLNKITKDSSGNLYVANSDGGARITKILPDGNYTTLANINVGASIWAIALAPDNNLYTFSLGANGRLARITLDGVVTLFSPIGGNREVSSICIGPKGNLFCFDGVNHLIYEYDLTGALINTIPLNWTSNYSTHQDITYNNGYFYCTIFNSVYRFTINENVANLVETINVGSPDNNLCSIIVDKYGIHILSLSTGNLFKLKSDNKVLKTNSTGLVVKTTYLEDIPYIKASDVDLSSYAKTVSPILTGIPTVPTAVAGTNTTQIANTAFVTSAIIEADSGNIKTTGYQSGLTGLKVWENESFDTTNGAKFINSYYGSYYSSAALVVENLSGSSGMYGINKSTGNLLTLNSDTDSNGALISFRKEGNEKASVNSLGEFKGSKFILNGGTSSQFLKADGSVDSNTYLGSASPNLTGVPTAPTAAVGTNTTQIATTAFVLANASASNNSSGSFTPTISESYANVSGTSILTANYTKVGNIVNVQYAVNLNIVASNTNSFFEVQAPFLRAGSTLSYYVGQGTVYATGLPQGIPGQAYFLSNNPSYIRFLFTSETGYGPRNITFNCQYDVTK